MCHWRGIGPLPTFAPLIDVRPAQMICEIQEGANPLVESLSIMRNHNRRPSHPAFGFGIRGPDLLRVNRKRIVIRVGLLRRNRRQSGRP